MTAPSQPSVPDHAHCYVCERIALRPDSLTLNDLDTLVRGGMFGDRHVADVASNELLRRLAASSTGRQP